LEVVVTGTCGLVSSDTATLRVSAETAITTQPTNQAACLGSSATFSAAASGAGLTYQWRKNGVNISGATMSSYTTPTTTAGDNGALFSVVVSGACGAPVTSNNAPLSILSNSTVVVTSNADSGTGSLRAAIDAVCPLGGAITFASGISLITLTSGELV